MQQVFHGHHHTDEDGNPTGGHSSAVGIDIHWQNGPLGRGEDRQPPNGAFVETVIAMAKDRLNFYQRTSEGKFACKDNADAISFLDRALMALEHRTAEREARQVEGTHAV